MYVEEVQNENYDCCYQAKFFLQRLSNESYKNLFPSVRPPACVQQQGSNRKDFHYTLRSAFIEVRFVNITFVKIGQQ